MYSNIMTATSRPFMLQMDNWIYEGKLYDPNGEFFISADLRVPVEALWYKRQDIYTIVRRIDVRCYSINFIV